MQFDTILSSDDYNDTTLVDEHVALGILQNRFLDKVQARVHKMLGSWNPGSRGRNLKVRKVKHAIFDMFYISYINHVLVVVKCVESAQQSLMFLDWSDLSRPILS